MAGEIPSFYREEARLFREEQLNRPKWQEHYRHAMGLVRQAIDLSAQKEHALIIGHGHGKELPPQILDFQRVTINDIDHQVLKDSLTEYESRGAKRGQVQAIAADITGMVDDIDRKITQLPENISEVQLILYMRSLRDRKRTVSLGIPSADLTVSSLVLPHTWREPIEIINMLLRKKFGEKNSFLAATGAIVATEDLAGFMFDEHMQFLKRHTKESGVIALITQIRRGSARYPQARPGEVLPPGGEAALRGLALRSSQKFGVKTTDEWDWQFGLHNNDDILYRVLGVIIDPREIPEMVSLPMLGTVSVLRSRMYN